MTEHEIVDKKLICPSCFNVVTKFDAPLWIEIGEKIDGAYCCVCYAKFISKNVPKPVEAKESAKVTIKLDKINE